MKNTYSVSLFLFMFTLCCTLNADVFLSNQSDYNLIFKFALKDDAADEKILNAGDVFKVDQTKDILYTATKKDINGIPSFIFTPKIATPNPFQLPCRLALKRYGFGSAIVSNYQQIDTAGLQEKVNRDKEENKNNDLYLEIKRGLLGAWDITPVWKEKNVSAK